MLKRILRLVLSKTFAFAVLIVLQVLVFCVLIYQLASYGAAIYGLFTAVSVLVLAVVLAQDELNPAYKLMWTLVIIFMPLFGALFYLLWGHRTVPRRKRRQLLEIDRRSRRAMVQNPDVFDALARDDAYLAQNAHYLMRNAACPVYPSEGVVYFPLGEDFFPLFLNALRSAKKYIFLEYYIYEEGTMLDATMDILRQKAAEGVDVRVMWDGFGSLFTLPPNIEEKWESWGIKCALFGPVQLTLHVSDYAMLNHRDHRKITVVDGTIGFTGGLNIADEYINLKTRFGVWKDSSFMLRGAPVYALVTTFLRLWDYAAGTASKLADYRPPAAPPAPCNLQQGYVQPYWDSPLDSENVSENVYLNIIHHARHYVYISTPYLILDHEMISSLGLAAKNGVDVRILTPGIPDKPTVFLVTQSYYAALLKEGVRIYEYTPGFNHAKMYVSDDKAVVIGSANMDYRSLYLHFENCVAFYGGGIVTEAKRDMDACFALAHEITLDDVKNIRPHRRLIQIIAKFFAPLL